MKKSNVSIQDLAHMYIKGGAIILARQILNSEIFADKPADWFKIWVYILLMVSHKDTKRCNRGSAYFNAPLDAKILKISLNVWYGCIRWLKSAHQITTLKTKHGVVISVINYNYYQDLTNYIDQNKNQTKTKQVRTPNNNKNESMKKIHSQIFDWWNQQGIIKHKKLSDKMQRAINGKITEGKTPKEICRAIVNYRKIVKGKQYWFHFEWTLQHFLQRGIDQFMDFRTAHNNYLRHDREYEEGKRDEEIERKREQVKTTRKRSKEMDKKLTAQAEVLYATYAEMNRKEYKQLRKEALDNLKKGFNFLKISKEEQDKRIYSHCIEALKVRIKIGNDLKERTS